MIEFFKRLFAPEASGATARERLRLVLLADHLSLSPAVVESLRADLIAVISRYVEVDEAHCDVSFEQQDRAVAVLANIPIVALRSRGEPPSGGTPSGGPPTPEPPSRGGAVGAAYSLSEPATDENSAGLATSESSSVPRRRRRRRRPAVNAAAAAG